MSEQTEAQRLAEALDSHREPSPTHYINQAAAELRRLEAESARMRSEVQALHKSLADSVLHAETGWARYESANRMRNQALGEVQALRGAVAAGWRLAPLNPTPEMKKVGGIACGFGQDIAHHTYAAMIAAAPKPAAQGEKQ